jgi:signal transduction histidine kinase
MTGQIRIIGPRFERWLAVTVVLVASLLTATGRGAEAKNRFEVTDVGHDTIVLHRARANGEGQEGLVIDSKSLIQSLKTRVLEENGLGEVGELSEGNSVRSTLRSRESAASVYTFEHRFAAPFASLEASLRLRPLAEPDAGALIYPMMALLAAAIVGGLYALYRMTATQVQFAERRNNFVSAVSHELKTPLTAIRMYSEMLQEDLVEDSRRHEYYRTITAESERLSRLINNVLEMSHIERQPQALRIEAGDLCTLVRETLDVLRPHTEKEGFTLGFEVRGEPPSARFDPDAMKQVLFNLIDNAVKYGRDAEDKHISVSCEPCRRGSMLRVRDRGPGVRGDHLRAIFEPFFRGEAELTRRHQGTGIGLSLVKTLVERMGGRVHGENVQPGFEVRVELLAAVLVAVALSLPGV